MRQKRLTYAKNILLPCLVFSVITGIFTGALIFLFKIASSAVFSLSARLYGLVRANPIWLPCLLVGAGLVGVLSALILKYEKNCRGGGIPTSVAILRGLIDFSWLKNIILLFASSMLTFLGGVPLGNEGPSVQMGTAVGRGTVRIFGKDNPAWDRYIMTGGACGGFAAATGAPLSGIFFAFEEAHRRFSPMIFMVASMTVISATATMNVFCGAFGVSPYMFDFGTVKALPLRFIWLALLLGVVCGFIAVAFTKLYSRTGAFLSVTLKALPFTLKAVIIFVLVALCGFASGGLVGSGHGLIEELVHGHGVWYMLILYFCVRALFLMLANQTGISGGLFIPTLTFGALIGALFAKGAMAIRVLPEQYFIVFIIIGMVAFLGASSRTPIMALTFSLEALSGVNNILPIAVGVTLAFLVIEAWGIISFNDTVMEQKAKSFRKGKRATEVDVCVTVKGGAFAVGKEVRDILWPPACTVLSVEKASSSAHEIGIGVGDALHLKYITYDEQRTKNLIEAIVGKQGQDTASDARTVDEKHIIPDN